MVMAKVEMGGDPAHAPARRSHEKEVTRRCRWYVISCILELPGDATHEEMALGMVWQEAK